MLTEKDKKFIYDLFREINDKLLKQEEYYLTRIIYTISQLELKIEELVGQLDNLDI